jgi:hypothetical protein
MCGLDQNHTIYLCDPSAAYVVNAFVGKHYRRKKRLKDSVSQLVGCASCLVLKLADKFIRLAQEYLNDNRVVRYLGSHCRLRNASQL